MAELGRLITKQELRRLVPYSGTHIARLERRHQFPRRVRIGANRIGWLESEVFAWIEEKAQAREAKQRSVSRAANEYA